MRAFLVTCGVLLGLALACAVWFAFRYEATTRANHENPVSRIRYPSEERIAEKLCGKQRLLYWWTEDPRRKSVTMHAHCAGQVTVVRDVAIK